MQTSLGIRDAVLAVVLLVLAAAVFGTGARWGLPSAGRNSLYFADAASMEDTIQRIPPDIVAIAATQWGSHALGGTTTDEEKLPRSLFNSSVFIYLPSEFLTPAMPVEGSTKHHEASSGIQISQK